MKEVYDFLKDDIPEITEEAVDRLIEAFDGAKMHGWESGDNQAKINRIKKNRYYQELLEKKTSEIVLYAFVYDTVKMRVLSEVIKF